MKLDNQEAFNKMVDKILEYRPEKFLKKLDKKRKSKVKQSKSSK